MPVKEVKEKKEKSGEWREKRGKAIAAMGLVDRDGDHFNVAVPNLRGRQTSYRVRRDETGTIRCNCFEFEEIIAGDSSFRCEHILAVKQALVAKNTEPTARANGKETVSSESKQKTTTESRLSERGEQETESVPDEDSANRQAESTTVEPVRLTTKGEKTMKHNSVKEIEIDTEREETFDNVLDFTSTLKELRKNVDPHLVKQREGWRDRNGRVQMVDYVEWHTVADILDQTAPNWGHSIKEMREVGEIMTVTVAITIDGVTREGIGTGLTRTEMGIKKAEHDALKRAAVKFGIARELYRKEFDAIEREETVKPAISAAADGGFPSNPVSQNMSDLVTAKQLGMIRALARDNHVDPDDECMTVMNCTCAELTRRAASALIGHLQEMDARSVPMRQAS
ncbi:MAG: Rad52/Rad22 family DNA repair protein [Pyrinomonadaceae bacterium]